MSCEELKDLAEKLVQNDSVLQVYDRLAQIFEQAGLYQELSGTLEKIYNINHDPQLCLIMGNIMLDKLNNKHVAKIAYEKYLYLCHPDMFNKYLSLVSPENCVQPDVLGNELQLKSDRYITTIYIMICLFHHNKLDEIVKLSKNIEIIKNEIDTYCKETGISDVGINRSMEDAARHLSQLLTRNFKNSEINRVAAILDPTNRDACLNVVIDMIGNKLYKDALKIFNTDCYKFFGNKKLETPDELCWLLSDKFAAEGDFFKALAMKKIAVDVELNTNKK